MLGQPEFKIGEEEQNTDDNDEEKGDPGLEPEGPLQKGEFLSLKIADFLPPIR
jgi:hypothetical protein